MRKYNDVQLKFLSEFFNMGAAAWFAGGFIAPVFAGFSGNTKPQVIIGIIMSWVFLRISLYLLREVKH